jgi:hypothetical protein
MIDRPVVRPVDGDDDGPEGGRVTTTLPAGRHAAAVGHVLPPGMEPTSASPTLVIDTNVLIDVHSCHDYTLPLDKALEEHGEAGAWQPNVQFRGYRARAALLLALYLHETGATTYGSHGEFLEKIVALVPPAPDEPGGRNWELDYTSQFIYFVRDHVLTGWNHTTPAVPETERGSAGDQWLVNEAARLKVPLVSNEGLRTDFTLDPKRRGIRKMADEAGVQVLIPRKVFAGKMDEHRSSERFLQRFTDEAVRHVRGRTDQLGRMLQMMQRYYHTLLS